MSIKPRNPGSRAWAPTPDPNREHAWAQTPITAWSPCMNTRQCSKIASASLLAALSYLVAAELSLVSNPCLSDKTVLAPAVPIKHNDRRPSTTSASPLQTLHRRQDSPRRCVRQQPTMQFPSHPGGSQRIIWQDDSLKRQAPDHPTTSLAPQRATVCSNDIYLKSEGNTKEVTAMVPGGIPRTADPMHRIELPH